MTICARSTFGPFDGNTVKLMREGNMYRKLILLAVVALVLVGCGSSSGPDASEGEKLFNSATIGSDAGCITCHSVDPDKVIVGPSLAGIATDAAGDAADEGITTEAMLKIMITEPNAEVVEGFPADTMPQDFATQMSSQQLDDVIAYLMTLK